MRRVFDFEGPFFQFFSRAADLMWLNLLFLVCSIPIVTIGASLTAMNYVALKMVKDEDSHITRSFFKSFKQNFLQATGIWLLLLLVGFVVLSDYRIVTNPAYSQIITSAAIKNVIMVASMVMGIIYAFILVYVFPILAKFDNSIKNTIKNAFIMSIRHLPQTVLLVIIPVIPMVLMYFSAALIILVLFVFALVAYISAKIFDKIFVFYIPSEENSSSGEGNGEEA